MYQILNTYLAYGYWLSDVGPYTAVARAAAEYLYLYTRT